LIISVGVLTLKSSQNSRTFPGYSRSHFSEIPGHYEAISVWTHVKHHALAIFGVGGIKTRLFFLGGGGLTVNISPSTFSISIIFASVKPGDPNSHENHHCEKHGNTPISPNLSHKL
jgi:hypothetical protein